MGLGAVMTYVKKAGYEFDLLDICVHDYSDDYVKSYIEKNTYDVVLFGSIVTHYKWIKWLVKTVKDAQPECKVVVGNSVAGSIWSLFLTKTSADVAVIGEGDATTKEILDRFKNKESLHGLQGIAFRDADGKIVLNDKRIALNINELPMIDWELFEVPKYFEMTDKVGAWGAKDRDDGNWRTMPVSTARGCVFKCTFCHYVFWDDPYRHRTAESILSECKHNIDHYGANYINFWDDLSFSSINHCEKIVDGILESGMKFSWSAAIRADLLGNPKIDYEKRLRVARKMKESGCISTGFSLESASPEILKMMNKKIEPHYFAEQVELLRKVGIVPSTSVVFGYPIETRETIKQTMEYCKSLQIYPSMGMLLPLPYTKMYDYAKEHGFIPDEDSYLESITERQDLCLNMTQMSDQELMDALKEGAASINQELNLGLSEDSFLKTGGYRKHTKLKDVREGEVVDPDKMKRNENDFSFNYSSAVFDMNENVIAEKNAETEKAKN